jgi:abortive infection bacteriophage resistance protein
MATYLKPALTIEEQVDYLLKKQLEIPDISKPANYLSHINYYRLKAYMIPFYKAAADIKELPKHFRAGITFNDILDLYIFDRKLRLLVFDAIEKIEIALRAQIIYHLSVEYGAEWYNNLALFRDSVYFDAHAEQLKGELDRSSEEFIRHYRKNYDAPEFPPAWMTFEVLSMGLLSKVFANLKSSKAKKAIADHFGLPNAETLESWMKALSYVRNICAHHGRLWNRVLTLKPQMLKSPKAVWLKNQQVSINRLYVCLSTIIYLLRIVTPSTNFAEDFKQLHKNFLIADLHKMGFPEDWENEPLWQ